MLYLPTTFFQPLLQLHFKGNLPHFDAHSANNSRVFLIRTFPCPHPLCYSTNFITHDTAYHRFDCPSPLWVHHRIQDSRSCSSSASNSSDRINQSAALPCLSRQPPCQPPLQSPLFGAVVPALFHISAVAIPPNYKPFNLLPIRSRSTNRQFEPQLPGS